MSPLVLEAGLVKLLKLSENLKLFNLSYYYIVIHCTVLSYSTVLYSTVLYVTIAVLLKLLKLLKA